MLLLVSKNESWLATIIYIILRLYVEEKQTICVIKKLLGNYLYYNSV